MYSYSSLCLMNSFHGFQENNNVLTASVLMYLLFNPKHIMLTMFSIYEFLHYFENNYLICVHASIYNIA